MHEIYPTVQPVGKTGSVCFWYYNAAAPYISYALELFVSGFSSFDSVVVGSDSERGARLDIV